MSFDLACFFFDRFGVRRKRNERLSSDDMLASGCKLWMGEKVVKSLCDGFRWWLLSNRTYWQEARRVVVQVGTVVVLSNLPLLERIVQPFGSLVPLVVRKKNVFFAQPVTEL